MRLLLRVAFLTAVAAGLQAKPPIMTPVDTPVIGEMDAYLIKNIYKSKDPSASLASVQKDPAYQKLIRKHNLRLLGGPMVGSVTANSAKIWMRTTTAATVSVRLIGGGSPVPDVKAQTGPEGDFTAIVTLSGLTADTEYTYTVLVNGKPTRFKEAAFRTFPSKGQKTTFSVGFGGGARYNPPKEKIWSTIASRNPVAFLFLGDNIYIDEPKWPNRQRAMYYRRQMHPDFQALTSSTAIYSIWDDHDFGKNDSSGGPHPFKPDWKLPVWRIFKQNWVNPGYGGGEKQPGCWYKFSIGDVEFFMTDGRYYRDFKKGKTMLGPVQKKWLLESLAASKATFKVIASGTLWTEHADKGGKDSWWGVPEEREEIFSLIDRKKIGGVFLISADRHRTEVFKIKRPNGYTLYELETSKLTNNHTHRPNKAAIFSYNKGTFFGLMRFDFTKKDPTM
ncbi:MAG: alkaline phosphatase D family protein, partial [Phycisphaeraceae bacterium]|nr:alkaline phosphatase D family protein [Phycisphaeraceae bacterium]